MGQGSTMIDHKPTLKVPERVTLLGLSGWLQRIR